MFARSRDITVNNPADPARWVSALSTTGSERQGGDVDRGFRLAIEDMPNAVLISGESGGVLVANRAAERLFGYAQGQMVGQPIERLMPGWSPRIKAEPWRRRPVTGVRSDGGVVPLDIDIAPVLDGPVRYVVTYIGGANGGLASGAGPTEAGSGIADIQRVIADMATRLVTIEPHSVDDNVGESLREIAKVLRLDRAILWRKAPADAITKPSNYAIGYPESSHHELLLELAAVQFIASKLEAHEVASFMQLREVPSQDDRDAFLRLGLRSAAVVPVAATAAAGRSALFFGSTTEREWPTAIVEQLRLVAAVVGHALARKANLTALQGALDDLRRVQETVTEENETGADVRVLRESRMRAGLHMENLCHRRELQESPDPRIIGRSAAIRRVLAQLQQVGATDSTVLLLGETGTGKELLATHLHGLSARRIRPMVRVNCAAIPATLMESELFGRERGAFTGALAREIGRFELAHRSTIFLDEIGDLPPDLQVKLLRVLEERQIERLGSTKVIDVDLRIIAATHCNLEQRIGEGAFREDLFYRLNVFPIHVPALRDRAEDIPLLVWRFVDEFSKAFGKQIDAIPRENMLALQQYSWPGNIRELRNVVERAMIVATGNQLTICLPTSSSSPKKCGARLVDVEKDHIRSVLETTMWRIRGVGGAAERLGLRPTTLESRMAKLGLSRPKP
jgi:formate hydrogenlyase transcriptional activator